MGVKGCFNVLIKNKYTKNTYTCKTIDIEKLQLWRYGRESIGRGQDYGRPRYPRLVW